MAPADPCLKQQDLQTEERWRGSFTEAELWSNWAWVQKQSKCAQQVWWIHQYSHSQVLLKLICCIKISMEHIFFFFWSIQIWNKLKDCYSLNFCHDNLVCYKVTFFFLRVTSTIWAVIRLHVFLCVDEEELPESEEDFPDLWSSPGRIYQPGGPQVHPVSVHCPYVWPALQADDGEVRGGNSGFELKSTC